MAKFSFKINFDEHTKRIRDSWGEGKYKFVIALLEDIGIHSNIELCNGLLSGKYKLINNPEGVGGIIVDDNTLIDLKDTRYEYYPEYSLDLENLQVGFNKAKVLFLNKKKFEILELLDRRKNNKYWSVEDEKYLMSLDYDLFEYSGLDKDDVIYGMEYLPKPRAKYIVVQEKEKKNTESLKPSAFTTTSKFNNFNGKTELFIEGWLSPTGDWYPHAYGKHYEYAERLVHTVGIPVKDFYGSSQDKLYESGWLTLHAGSGMGTFMICGWKNDITKEQKAFFSNGKKMLMELSETSNKISRMVREFHKASKGDVYITGNSPYNKLYIDKV